MDELLSAKGLVKVAEEEIRVTGLKGPLEEGCQKEGRGLRCSDPTDLREATAPHMLDMNSREE